MSAPPANPPPTGDRPTAIDTGSLRYQFSGYAAWSIAVGLFCIVVPFLLNRPLYFLPIVGVLGGVQAIRRGRMIGGIVGIVLSVIGGIITLIALYG